MQKKMTWILVSDVDEIPNLRIITMSKKSNI